MEFINFPIVALGAALVCLIGVSIYAITQRSSLRSRDEQLVVARAQAYAMLELSRPASVPGSRTQAHGRSLVGRAGVVGTYLRCRHRLRAGDRGARRRQGAPRLRGLSGSAVERRSHRPWWTPRRTRWRACTPVRAISPLRFARLVVDGRVHHIIVSIERISAPRVVPHTIEVPALNEETFAKRLAGETGTRPALKQEALAGNGVDRRLETGAVEQPVAPPPSHRQRLAELCRCPRPNLTRASRRHRRFAAVDPNSNGQPGIDHRGGARADHADPRRANSARHRST